MQSRTAFATLGLLLACSTVVVRKTCADPLTETISKVSRSLVIVHGRDESDGRVVGTGFCIAPDGLIVTAFHTVVGGDVRVGVPRGANYVSTTAKLVASDAEHDICLLKINQRLPALKMRGR